MKKPDTKLWQQIAWFIAIYFISILGLGAFHLFSKWLINVLK